MEAVFNSLLELRCCILDHLLDLWLDHHLPLVLKENIIPSDSFELSLAVLNESEEVFDVLIDEG